MNDQELDTLVARAAPVSDADIADWTRTAPFPELCEAIMSTTSVQTPNQEIDTPPIPIQLHRDRRPRRWRRVGVFAAAAAAVVGVVVVTNVGGDGDRSTAWAAPLVDFAERSPLMLISDADWQVTRADEESDGEGEMTFTNGDRDADLSWPSGPLDEWLYDRRYGNVDHGTHPVVNGTATIIQYADSTNYTALWEGDGRVLEFRADADSVEAFESLLDSLVIVDVDTWLTAMPDSVIKQADQSTVIADMLTGVPLPAGFDPGTIPTGASVKDRYQLGADVVATVSCMWIGQWIDATTAGDATAVQAAVDAMSTSSEWPIIQEMNESGDYGQVLQEHVTAMSTDTALLGGKGPTVADSYEEALGCAR